MQRINPQIKTERTQLLQALAEFRHQLRSFLQFSEQASHGANLHPQQHQLLLQVAGVHDGIPATIAYAAERLGLRHHSAVELVNRSVAEGLLTRTEDPEDGRRVLLVITAKGRRILDSLSEYHVRELRELGPRLVRALNHIEQLERAPSRAAQRSQA